MSYDLKALRECADEACDLAHAAGIQDAINWGDLGCVYAYRFTRDYDGGDREEGYAVHIEECAPDCRGLSLFISDHLEAAGFSGIEVEMEW